MKVVVIILLSFVIFMFGLAFLLSKTVFAQNIVSTTTIEVYDASQKYNSDYDSVGNPRLGRRNPNEMESMNEGKTLRDSVGINTVRKYSPQYHGQKDRYDVNLFKNDPETLVSGAKHSSGVTNSPENRERITFASKNTEVSEEQDVTATAYLEDEATGTTTPQTNCNTENDVLICNAF